MTGSPPCGGRTGAIHRWEFECQGVNVSIHAHRVLVGGIAVTTACLLFSSASRIALAQTALPKIEVGKPKQAQKRAPAKKQVARRPAPAPAARPAPAIARPAPAPTPEERQAAAEQRQVAANRQVVQQTQTFDQRRDNVLLPKVGTTNYELSQRDIENIPQGNAVQLSDLVLQFPGVYQDSTSSGDFHIRNEHANVQYRINGILLPDGVSGFSQILETSFISNLRLITGALPAQYGLRTTAIIDITAKSGTALSGGSATIYGGSRETISPSFEYGGVEGNTEYFVTGRYFSTNLGLENPTGALNALHDHSQQGRFFSYTSTLLDPTARLVTIAGFSETSYQIPNNPGQAGNVGGFNGQFNPANGCVNPDGTPNPTAYTAFGKCGFDSSTINQNQYEKNAYGVVAWQRSEGNFDAQLAYYTRYSDLHFVPDPVGDLFTNNVASDVFRSTFLNGVSGDFSTQVNAAHTVRYGFYTQGEQTRIATVSTVQCAPSGLTSTPANCAGIPADPSGLTATDTPFNITDMSEKFGMQLGAYAQDEWKLTDKLILNYGVRFDQIFQYVDANQLSPRASLTFTPWSETTLHIGYMRTFTPPPQVLGRAPPTQIYDGTTAQAPILTPDQAAAIPGQVAGQPLRNVGAIEPERAHVFDAGFVQQLLPQCPKPSDGMPTKAPPPGINCPSLEFGASVYYKVARDLLDDGQFGQAYTLTAFNYAQAENYGGEAKLRFRSGNFSADANFAYGLQHATQVVSNQTLFSPDDLAYIQTHWIHTDHDQTYTASGRVAYRWTDTHSWLDGTAASATVIFGSGLRTSPAGEVCPNCDHLPSYYQINVGLSHEFANGWNGLPYTVRFDVVNVTDNIYEIRNGLGIGVFAPQFGPRRGYYMGISQKIGNPDKTPDSSPNYYTKAAAAIAYHWAGPYVGANFGGAFSSGETVLTPIGSDTINPSGVLGGFQLGYNYLVTPTWLVGIEGELDWTTAEGKSNFVDPAGTASLSITSDHRWYDTVSGRIGRVMGPLMVYAKGGAAWMNADARMEVNSGLDGLTLTNTTSIGWNVGAGLEYMLGSRWSAKAEFDHLDFGSRTLGFVNPFGNSVTCQTAVNEVKAGVNYHFDGTGPF
ncbi:MAG: TonB-dependent receptor [Hyphomicrobiales bacterium]|nr:TonB-dependent receptor [Hyphomicrobiales bacterium]